MLINAAYPQVLLILTEKTIDAMFPRMKNFIVLSDTDRRKIKAYVEENSGCTHENYEMLETVLGLTVIPPKDPSGKTGSYPVAVFYCKDCGFVKLYDIGKLHQLLSLSFS